MTAGKRSSFPLTVHDSCWDASASPVGDRVLNAGGMYYKCVDDPARAFGVATALPHVTVIYRKVPPADVESLSAWRRHPDFPTEHDVAAAWVRLTDIQPAPNIWVEGINEPVLANTDDARWLGRVEAIRATMLAARGLHAVIGNFATGNPSPGLFRAFISEYLAHGGPRHAIGCHEYGTFDLDPGTDRDNWLGHVRLANETVDLDTRNAFLWFVTECGLDRVMVGGAWRGAAGWQSVKVGDRALTQSELWGIAVRYVDAVKRYGFAKCLCWFTYGDTGKWSQFEMSQADEFNNALVAAVEAAQSTPAAPNCNNPNPPIDWTHTVDASIGLNVRSTAEVPPATTADPSRKRNVVCAMANGQKVRVTGMVGTWARIDWPTVGFCNAPNLDVRTPPTPAERQLAPAFQLTVGDLFVDVSANQAPADMDWTILKFHEYRAVMIRLAIGLQVDAVWNAHWQRARGYLARFGYSVFTFTATPSRQADVLSTVLDSLPQIPTVAIDLETSNPSKSADGLNQYIEILTGRGVPLAWYGRASWVAENLSDLSRLAPLPFIVAHYKHPMGTAPASPPGIKPSAWQYVAGEKVVSDGMYWGYAKTRRGAFLDESVVVDSWTIHAA